MAQGGVNKGKTAERSLEEVAMCEPQPAKNIIELMGKDFQKKSLSKRIFRRGKGNTHHDKLVQQAFKQDKKEQKPSQ